MSEFLQLAQWMIVNGFATGHGDTFKDLLKELTWQIEELRNGTNDRSSEAGSSEE